MKRPTIKLYNRLEEFETVVFREAAQQVRQYHLAQAHLPPDSDQVLDISVSYDGSWLTRGHSSHVGVGCVIDIATGLCIDAHVMCTYCQVCESTGKKILNERPLEYAAWLVNHMPKCDNNYKGKKNFISLLTINTLNKTIMCLFT